MPLSLVTARNLQEETETWLQQIQTHVNRSSPPAGRGSVTQSRKEIIASIQRAAWANSIAINALSSANAAIEALGQPQDSRATRLVHQADGFRSRIAATATTATHLAAQTFTDLRVRGTFFKAQCSRAAASLAQEEAQPVPKPEIIQALQQEERDAQQGLRDTRASVAATASELQQANEAADRFLLSLFEKLQKAIALIVERLAAPPPPAVAASPEGSATQTQ
jgi:hypothetical protein